MKRVLLLDTETTGTDEGAACVEVAVALFSVPHATVLRSFSSLISHPTNEAEAINGISVDVLAEAPLSAAVWALVNALAREAEAIVSHGAEFDRRFVPEHVAPGLPWICTLEDVLWPRARRPGESLVALALAHGLGVGSAHRAMADVDLLARLLGRVKELGGDVGGMLARGLRPKARFAVADRRFDPARNELAKAHGFAWDRPAAPKQWSRAMAREDAAALPFEVVEVAPC